MIVKRFLVMGIANEIANTGGTNVTIVQLTGTKFVYGVYFFNFIWYPFLDSRHT